jgi:putative ABC transport system permease protein
MLKNYLKIAFKVFLRRKFFTFISLFGISLTLVVLMVVASFFDHFFGPFPPEVKQDRTLFVFGIHLEYPPEQEHMGTDSQDLSLYFVDHFIRPLDHVEKVSVREEFAHSVTHYNERGDKVDSWLKHTDAAFWDILEFEFLEGSAFTEREVAEADRVAVINEATRRELFGDERAVGRIVKVDKQRLRVVGVVANVPIFRHGSFADIWVPYSINDRFRARPLTGGWWDLCGEFQAMILAEKRSDLPLIQEEFRQRLSVLEFPEEELRVTGVHGYAETFFEYFSHELFDLEERGERYPRLFLGFIFGGMILFMILPTLNLVNLNLSRIVERASEIGVRKAFGASSQALVGQFVVENVLLTLMGGLLGLAASAGVLRFLSEIELVPYAQFHMNLRIFYYGMLLALFFGVFSGVYPAWKMSRLHPVESLRRRKK